MGSYPPIIMGIVPPPVEDEYPQTILSSNVAAAWKNTVREESATNTDEDKTHAPRYLLFQAFESLQICFLKRG
jgi:hypothetical protein